LFVFFFGGGGGPPPPPPPPPPTGGCGWGCPPPPPPPPAAAAAAATSAVCAWDRETMDGKAEMLSVSTLGYSKAACDARREESFERTARDTVQRSRVHHQHTLS
jgi:hypothetical protein